MAGTGIDSACLHDPKAMVSDLVYYAFLENVAGLDSAGHTLPLRVGASMRCDDYGAFGLAWKSALNLRSSCERAERYARVLTSVTAYELETAEGGVFMNLHRDGHRRLGLRLSNEASLASIISISREVSTQPCRPIAVHFQHTAPSSTRAHEDYFGCPVHFESGRDALLFSDETLAAPNQLGDEGLSRFFENHLESELSVVEADPSLASRVRRQVSQALSEGVPTLSEVAGRLGMSGRTLQRRLAKQGHSFITLVDDTRRQLAMRLLRQTDYSLAEVAFMTGFSEQSAFTRAFKRWQGQTPRSFRLAAIYQA
ncbi:MAG: AraC family transcriptional regulator [Opitutaceae bacterium]